MWLRQLIERLGRSRGPIDIHVEFSAILDDARMQDVSGSPMPPSPDSPYKHEYVLINILYNPSMAQLAVSDFLCVARADTLSVLKMLITKRWLRRFGAYYIRFYLPRGTQGGQEWVPGGRLRLYQYRILTEGLCIESSSLNGVYMLSNRFFHESSEVEEVASMLESQRDTEAQSAPSKKED